MPLSLMRLAVTRMMFTVAGLGISVWAITVPYTKIRFGLSDGTLGFILLAGGSGGVSVMPVAGWLIGRLGSRTVLVVCTGAVGIIMPLLNLVPNAAGFTAMLFCYGVLYGTMDMALNAQGAIAERQSGTLLMSGFHACYSLGSLIVAVAASLLLGLGLGYALTAAVNTVIIFLVLSQMRFLADKAEDAPSSPTLAIPNAASFVLGFCCFACFLTEGAATDWSTIYLRFSRGLPLSTAALGYAAFAIAMTLARLTGDAVATKLGQVMLMRLGCIVAFIGFVAVVFCPAPLAGIIGFGLIGLGTGNIVPLVFSAAQRIHETAAPVSLPAVMAMGYAGFLIGPPFIGQIADFTSLGVSLGLVGVLLGSTFFLASALRR